MLNFNKDVLNAYVFHMGTDYILNNQISIKKSMSKEIPLHCADEPFGIGQVTQEYTGEIDRIIRSIIEKENLPTDMNIDYYLMIDESTVPFPDNTKIFSSNKFNMYAQILVGTQVTVCWGRFKFTFTYTIYSDKCDILTEKIHVCVEYKNLKNEVVSKEIIIELEQLKLEDNELNKVIDSIIDESKKYQQDNSSFRNVYL